MAEKIKAKVVETEEKSLQEKEQEVQKNSGFDEESGMYKVDLTQPLKKDEDAVQEQETEDRCTCSRHRESVSRTCIRKQWC